MPSDAGRGKKNAATPPHNAPRGVPKGSAIATPQKKKMPKYSGKCGMWSACVILLVSYAHRQRLHVCTVNNHAHEG